MPDVQLNSGNLVITLAIILIFLEGLNVVSKGIEAWRKITGKDARAQEMAEVKGRLSAIEAWQVAVDGRLAQGDHKFVESTKDTIEVLKTLHRIVIHLKSGNDRDKLQQTDDQLFEYLIKKGVSKDELD